MSAPISSETVRALQYGPSAPLLLDVRRAEAYASAGTTIAGALRRDPAALDSWQHELPRGRMIVVACAHGHEMSQQTAAALRAEGFDARYLTGGIQGWQDQGEPMLRQRPDLGVPGDVPSRWVTRARPKIDRIACPWLLRRFIDPLAEIIFVPADEVRLYAHETGAIPFDVPDVAFSHVGEQCSFDAFLAAFELDAAGLVQLGRIVRGADTARPELAPQAAGLLAISLGYSVLLEDDQRWLAKGIELYDALWAWISRAQDEVHTWRPVQAA
ncbi:MAG: hypothetical protein JWM77_1221 [Rhodospirillales bacterium]|nr:hypothetical protein [Rhodospirillales bacterium]